MEKVRYQSIVLIINSLAAVVVTTLLTLAIYVHLAHPVVGDASTPGFPAVNVNVSQWNIACAVLGTAVGMLVTAGLAYDDGFLTREAILSKESVAPFYLRPLTITRGMDQVKNGWSHATRMLLLFLTIIATLSTTATVAVFGVHNIEQLLLNPSASWPLATILNGSTDNQEQYLFGLASLDSFLFRSAFTQAVEDIKDSASDLLAWFPESGTLGSTLYPTLRTGGIGLNASSYIDYVGWPRTGFDVPATYEFNELHGDVFGTHIDVQCTNVSYTGKHKWVSIGKVDFYYYQIDTEKEAHFEMFCLFDNLSMGSALVNYTGTPILTIAIPTWTGDFDVLVSECTYSGHDTTASVSLASRVSPLEVVAVTSTGSSIDDDTKWILASSMNQLLSAQLGGSLTRAWQSAPFSTLDDTSLIISRLETVFSQMGEALISLKRQALEKADYFYAHTLPTGSAVTMSVTTAKLGGSSWSWLSVYILLLVGPLMSIFRSCRKSQVLQYDVQDPLKILEMTLEETKISVKSRIRFDERLKVISPADMGLLPNGEDVMMNQTEDAGERSPLDQS